MLPGQPGSASPILDVSALTGASPTARTAAMDLAVDGQDTVWLVAHGPGSWVERLLRSDQPFAAGQAFTDVGPISPTASAQNSRLAVDASGRVHCSYYRNVAPGIYEHRFYDPVSGWGAETTLGDTAAPNDYWGVLAADLLGNVHALYVEDCTSGSSLWQFRYKRWDAAGGWGPEVPLFDATQAQFSGIASYRIVALACDEASGEVSAVYRDLAGSGALRLAVKALADPGFTALADLTAPGTGLHEYHVPTVRGALHPAFNRTGTTLDLTWQHRPPPGQPPYELVYLNASSSLKASPAQLSPIDGGVQTFSLDAGAQYAQLPYLLLGTVSGTDPGFPIDGQLLPLNADAYTVNSLIAPSSPPLAGSFGTLDAQGRGSATFTLPPGLPASFAGVQLHHAFVVIELLPTLLHVVFASNPVSLTVTL